MQKTHRQTQGLPQQQWEALFFVGSPNISNTMHLQSWH